MQSNSPSVHFTAKENEAASSSMTRQSYNDDRERRPLAEDQLSSYYTFSAAAALLHRPEIDPRMFASEPISLAQPHGSNPSSGLALGTFRGVILPTCEFMWSVLIFIRFGWIVGSLGVAVAWALILLCAANVAITVSSLSAIATNGIPRGNVVHMLTKSLGSGLGGAITLMYYLGLSTFTAIEVVGSTQGLLLSTNISLTGASIYWDQVLIAIASIITIVFIPPMVGKGVVLRLSMFFMVALTIAYLSLISGLVAAPSVMNYDGQVTGIRRETFAENFGPPGPEEFAWRETLVLMVPCFVGIFTGVNQAAHLKNPLVSIPLGGFSAISISMTLYLCLTGLIGACIHHKILLEDLTVVPGIAWPDPWFAKVGLYLVGQGSALHSTVIGAHVLQSLATEEIVPGLKWLGLDIESQGIPRRAITFMTLLTMPFLFFPDLDTIATVVTMIFLLCYGLTNFACFLLSVFHQPNWRPHFRYYHPLLSLAGSVLAVVLMFQIHGFVATLAILTLLLIAWSIQLQGATAWGYGIHGLLFHLVITHLTQAEREEFFQNLPKIDLSPTDHPRDSLAAHSITIGNARLSPQAGTVHVTTWRPHIVSFVPSSPSTRRGLLSIIAQLRTKSQLCVLADLVTTEEVDTAVGKRDQDGRGGKITIAGEGIKPFRRQEVLDELVVRRKTLLQRGMEEEGIQGG
ncbi:amino acid permease-domain-containing protein [Jimgerdemannia flammicorona]|uniref:Amino acid permease-domain-containing protein n=1 Tax=Jimgerdemannia flammicorona TaxID=994334 RepID=A0A433D6R5_9FUNG|nr:amino acid permease-domain-containing protein [Jimgerdemannia flammicorona]